MCDCARAFQVRLGRETDIKEFWGYMTRWKYPSYLGTNTLQRTARAGGMFFFEYENQVIGTRLINPRNSTGFGLAIHPDHRGHGLFRAINDYTRPNFVRVIEKYLEAYHAIGYKEIGEPKQGRKMLTYVMVRNELFDLAGHVKHVKPEECTCHLEHATESEEGQVI